MKLRILILFLSMTAVLGACRSTETVSDPFFQPTEADMLTKEETESIIWHAKNFITSNKNLRLGKNHRKMIQDNDPVTRIIYSGKKHGRIEHEWPISSDIRAPQYRRVAIGQVIVLHVLHGNVNALLGQLDRVGIGSLLQIAAAVLVKLDAHNPTYYGSESPDQHQQNR